MKTADADVIVVGSGLAGMCAAFELAKRKLRVIVLEERDVIGGRTASWLDDGMPVESGLHKFLGVYRTLPRILRQAGVDLSKMLAWVDDVELHAADGKRALFTMAPYRKPLKTIVGLLGNNRYVPPLQKFKLGIMSAGALYRCATRPHVLDERSVERLAADAGISQRVIRDVLHVMTSAILFLPVSDFSAYAAFAPALGALKRGLTMGVGAFRGGMTEVMMNPLAEAIAGYGGTVQTGVAVRELLTEGGPVTGVRTNVGVFRAKHVVLATSLHAAQKILRDAFADHQWFAPMLSLPTLSAVTLQCELDRPLFPADHTHFADGPMVCFAEQCHTTFTHLPGRLSAILFPPKEFLDMPPERILARVEASADALGIRLRGHVTRYRVVRHPHDFYSMRPGSELLRPQQQTPVPGLTLAGDYTRQPWSASMEGAAISGVRAMQAVVRDKTT